MHIAVSTVNVKASSKYSIIIICLCLGDAGRDRTHSFNHTIRLHQQDCIGWSTLNGIGKSLPTHYLFFFWVRLNSMWIPCKRFIRLQGRNPSFDSVLIRNSLRQVKYSCDTSSFTLSKWLVPTLWSLKLISIPITSAVYVWTLRITIVS